MTPSASPAADRPPALAPSRPRTAVSPPRAGKRRYVEVAASLVYLAVASAANRIACLLGFGRARLVILYYHAVPAIHRARFARHLDMIRAGADAVVPADFCGPASPGRRLVAITFDDAFISVIDNALPELAARGMPATIFTPSGMLGRHPGWAMEIADEDRSETVADGACLHTLPHDLVTIGAHSVTHPRLPEIDRENALMEITGSKSALADLLGRDVTVFAFPYGEYDDQVVELCRAAKFRFVYTTMPHTLDPADASFVRGRVRADMDDWPIEFWLKLRGAYSWTCKPRQLKRWLRRRFNTRR